MESKWTPQKRDALVSYLEGHPILSGAGYETIIAALRWTMPVSVVRDYLYAQSSPNEKRYAAAREALNQWTAAPPNPD